MVNQPEPFLLGRRVEVAGKQVLPLGNPAATGSHVRWFLAGPVNLDPSVPKRRTSSVLSSCFVPDGGLVDGRTARPPPATGLPALEAPCRRALPPRPFLQVRSTRGAPVRQGRRRFRQG